ncbi:MAG: glycosyltransferase family 4 protein [Deltaproteobacteria bacterium]|nr:glycosyltransferase family 4 protein [Deltaproteobacteria bacterium]
MEMQKMLKNRRIVVLSDLLFLQRLGGLQRKVLQTINGLNRLGLEASFFDPVKGRLQDFDLAHVFDAEGGNNKLVATLKDKGLPVVLSPVINPTWTQSIGWRARICDKLISRVCSSKVHTSYRQTKMALDDADRLIALTDLEKRTLVEAFLVPESKVDVVPNGIAKSFFSADPAIFRQKFGIPWDFVLCVASIGPHKNQLGIVKALRNEDVPIVLIGPHAKSNHAYLSEILQYKNVHYLGALPYDDPLLPSAYAAARVFVLPSFSEVTPNGVFESLAVGTPVVVTDRHSMRLAATAEDLREVNPHDLDQLRACTLHFMNTPGDPDKRKRIVAEYTWDSAVKKIVTVYEKALTEARDLH